MFGHHNPEKCFIIVFIMNSLEVIYNQPEQKYYLLHFIIHAIFLFENLLAPITTPWGDSVNNVHIRLHKKRHNHFLA